MSVELRMAQQTTTAAGVRGLEYNNVQQCVQQHVQQCNIVSVSLLWKARENYKLITLLGQIYNSLKKSLAYRNDHDCKTIISLNIASNIYKYCTYLYL